MFGVNLISLLQKSLTNDDLFFTDYSFLLDMEMKIKIWDIDKLTSFG